MLPEARKQPHYLVELQPDWTKCKRTAGKALTPARGW